MPAMTKEGYTHIIVPKDLHEILKREAKARDMSISQYITEILSQIQSIKGLISTDSSINTLKNLRKGLNCKNNGLDAIRTHDLRLVKIKNTNLRSFFIENKEDFSFYLLNVRGIGEAKQHDYLNALEKKLIGIKSTNELKTHLSQAYTDPYARALKNLFNHMEYKEIEEFNGISIERWRKAIKLRRSGIREIYISDNELKEAYQSINEEVRPLFKLLVYSGARLTQAIEGMKRLGRCYERGCI